MPLISAIQFPALARVMPGMGWSYTFTTQFTNQCCQACTAIIFILNNSFSTSTSAHCVRAIFCTKNLRVFRTSCCRMRRAHITSDKLCFSFAVFLSLMFSVITWRNPAAFSKVYRWLVQPIVFTAFLSSLYAYIDAAASLTWPFILVGFARRYFAPVNGWTQHTSSLIQSLVNQVS